MSPFAQSPSGARTLEEPLRLGYELRDFERFPIAPLLKKADAKLYAQCVEIMARTRRFTERHLLGQVERWDELAAQDHDFVPWSAIDAGLQYGFLGMNVPGVFGGGNCGSLGSALFAEEVAAADAGVYVIYGAHALALALVLSSLDTRAILRLGAEIVSGEKRGEAVLLALAHTEPGGGSDVEDVDDMKHARYASRFVKVPGGYRVTARKFFISNGSIARYVVVTASSDLQRPLETMRAFIIKSGTEGLSVGRLEHKMGQRLSTAVEIVCDDVFVADEDAVDVADPARAIDTTLSLTRAPVGAMATGIVRGTLERTLRYLSHKRVRGHWLFEEQWVQLALADMLAALQAARALYIDASLASEAWGIASFMKGTPNVLPDFVRRSSVFSGIVTHGRTIELSRRRYEQQVPTADLQRLTAHASTAKFFCSDLSVQVAMKAMEILGEDANDAQWGVEKCMRDAKLGQIFEGTNQINRLHVARGMLVRR